MGFHWDCNWNNGIVISLCVYTYIWEGGQGHLLGVVPEAWRRLCAHSSVTHPVPSAWCPQMTRLQPMQCSYNLNAWTTHNVFKHWCVWKNSMWQFKQLIYWPIWSTETMFVFFAFTFNKQSTLACNIHQLADSSWNFPLLSPHYSHTKSV